MIDNVLAKDNTTSDLNQYVRSEVPGLQYIAVTADRILFEYADGWADIQGQKAMTTDTTLMAYSMTKTFTAVAILQLAAQRKLSLDDVIDRYLPNPAYHGHGITLRQLLNHTSGVPNPIPLRWVHLAVEDSSFNEAEALATVLRENPDLAFEPGRKFAYSNIGYWLLGKVVEQVSGQSYPAYIRENILHPLRLSAQEMDFVIRDESRHANGYLKKYSLMNLVKGFVIDSKFLGNYEELATAEKPLPQWPSFWRADRHGTWLQPISARSVANRVGAVRAGDQTPVGDSADRWRRPTHPDDTGVAHWRNKRGCLFLQGRWRRRLS